MIHLPACSFGGVLQRLLPWGSSLLVLAAACDRSEKSPAQLEPRTAPQPAPSATPVAFAETDLLGSIERCEVRHRGLSIDLGTAAGDVRRGYAVGPFRDVRRSTHGGSGFAAYFTRKVSYEFWLAEPASKLRLSMRGRRGYSRYTSGYLDDQRLGAVELPEEPGVVTLPALKGSLDAGRHQIVLRFSGRPTQSEPYAEIEWLRLFVEDDISDTYAAPTLKSILSDVVLGDDPRRSLVLRGPGSVRCGLRVVPGSRLRLRLGYWGAGEGVAQVRVLEDGQPPVVLSEQQVKGGEAAAWNELTLSLDAFASKVVALELSALSSQGTGRVAFGEPTLLLAEPERSVETSARNVIVIVASGLERSAVPPWGPAARFPALLEAVRSGTTFQGYRVPSSVIGASVASLLTGMGPEQHQVIDPQARLPASVPTIAGMIKASGARTAMFTGVPPSFRVFGFARGWDQFEQYSPVRDFPVTHPLRRATQWLEQQFNTGSVARRFVFVHLRGGHPPWDLARERVGKLPPDEYSGVVDPRRGGLLLSKVRHRRRSSRRRLRNEDWIRLRALQAETLADQDLELARLIRLLKEHEEWEHTALYYAGDVAMAEAPQVPFGATSLDEARLTPPLIVKWPASFVAPRRSNLGVTTIDMARTIVALLGVEPSSPLPGADLRELVQGREPLWGRTLLATLGNSYSVRWGSWLMNGDVGSTPTLCQLEVDPACAHDLLSSSFITAPFLWRRAFFELDAARTPSKNRVQRQQVQLDAETDAALTVWGR